MYHTSSQTPDVVEATTSPNARLIDALASYLTESRDRTDVRHAINRWRHDVVHAGQQPEKILVQFKDILLGLSATQRAPGYEARLTDRREMIVMCIEEYFANPDTGDLR